jgi:hypothetical protein
VKYAPENISGHHEIKFGALDVPLLCQLQTVISDLITT